MLAYSIAKERYNLKGVWIFMKKRQLYFSKKKWLSCSYMHSKLELNKTAETFDRTFLMSNRETSMCCFFPSNIDQNPNWDHHSILFEISVDQSVRL